MIVTPGQLSRRAELYHQIGSMLSAGVPLISALEMAGRNRSISGSRRTIGGLIHELQAGRTFSESMIKVQGWMPDFDISMLTAGEESGRLDNSFKVLSTYYAARASIIRDTIAGLLVTIATLHVFLFVFPVNLLVECALGIFNADYGRCVPFLIQKGVVFGILYGGVFLLIYACQGRHGEPWRAFIESITNVIPILRTARKYLVLSRLAGSLEALTSAGVPLVRGWELASAASGSAFLRHKVSKWGNRLDTGSTPAQLVSETSYFPEMFSNLYNTGEQSGRLDDALRRLQVYFQEEGFRKLRTFTRLMNGTIYGGIMLMVAFSVIRFWVNYYGNMIQSF